LTERAYDIEAIAARYKGVTFRSRLEARHAVFFDTLAFPWSYEAETFFFSDGTGYMPDFRIQFPRGSRGVEDCYYEVKPSFPTDEEIAKAQNLTKVTGRPTYIVYAHFPELAEGSTWGILAVHPGRPVVLGAIYGWAQCMACFGYDIRFEAGRWDACCGQTPKDRSPPLMVAYRRAYAFRFPVNPVTLGEALAEAFTTYFQEDRRG